MSKSRLAVAALAFAAVAVVLAASMDALAGRGGAGGRGDGPIVYVRSQELYYDSIVTADPVPAEGPFQRLYHPNFDDVTQLETDLGPGDPGFVGGRWWIDVDGDGEQSEGDHFFLCPLLGPGRDAP